MPVDVNTPNPPGVVDDPKKPYKAYVASAVAMITLVLAEYSNFLPKWLTVVLGVLLVGGTTYLKKNPKQRKRSRRT
jgi:hypothetical protein